MDAKDILQGDVAGAGKIGRVQRAVAEEVEASREVHDAVFGGAALRLHDFAVHHAPFDRVPGAVAAGEVGALREPEADEDANPLGSDVDWVSAVLVGDEERSVVATVYRVRVCEQWRIKGGNVLLLAPMRLSMWPSF